MNYSEIFKKAHAIAKNTVALFNAYRAAFSAALRKVYADLRKPRIEKVRVIWSESFIFEDETTYTYAEYTKRAKQVEIENGTEGGYCKTKIEIIYSNGFEYGCRHDIGCDHVVLTQRMAEAAAYCLSENCPEFMKPSEELAEFYRSVAA